MTGKLIVAMQTWRLRRRRVILLWVMDGSIAALESHQKQLGADQHESSVQR